MNLRLLKIDAKPPSESFGTVFTNYLSGDSSDSAAIEGTVMDNIWCRPGKTGILGLVLCLYWQAEYSGAGNEWKANIQHVERIFNAILAEPEL